MSTATHVLLDNPIIVKHIRSRLRTSQVVPGVIAILCVCAAFTWIGHAAGNMAGGGFTFGFLSSIMALILVIGGANQVAMTVGTAKESGILDFHRVSPLPPSTVAIGFFLGAPIREYIFAGLFVPFLIISAALAHVPVLTFLNALAPIFLTAWLIHSIALLSALTSKKPKAASAGIIVLTFIGLGVGNALLANIPAANLNSFGFFGIPLPRVLFLALYEGAATTFFLIAATRKMRSDRALLFAKWEALVCMSTVVALTLGAFWDAKGIPLLVVALLYVFMIAGLILASTITPEAGEYEKGVRRALRAGKRRAPPLSDSAANAWGVFGIAAWVAVGATIAWEAIELVGPANAGMGFAPMKLGRSAYSQTIAIGVFTVAYYGLGKQYFLLKFRRRGETYFRLFLFLIWLMPIIVGVGAGLTALGQQGIQMLMGLSPWAGLILSVDGGPAVNADAAWWVRFMALLPSITFAFVFNFLLMNEQRRIDRQVRGKERPKGEDGLVFE